jgi:cytochrome c5
MMYMPHRLPFRLFKRNAGGSKMKKKMAVIVAMAAFLVPLSQSGVFANDAGGETKYRFDPATQTSRALEFKNTFDGYKLYKSNCKSCHFRGNEQGARYMNEDSRTMKGWNTLFFKKNVQCAKDGSWAKLSPEELTEINDYLYSTAYDTWDPRSNKSCG